jgi:hypothetical protein
VQGLSSLQPTFKFHSVEPLKSLKTPIRILFYRSHTLLSDKHLLLQQFDTIFASEIAGYFTECSVPNTVGDIPAERTTVEETVVEQTVEESAVEEPAVEPAVVDTPTEQAAVDHQTNQPSTYLQKMFFFFTCGTHSMFTKLFRKCHGANRGNSVHESLEGV